jgi:uncharacterized protein YpuA (DUF1002 family)
MLAPLTYATALLAAGTFEASVTIAAPAARPVTGETAIVGMLRASGRCTDGQSHASTRVGLGYLVLQLTSQVADASGDWPSASSIIVQTVHAVVTGHARDEAGIASALDVAVAETGVTLERPLRAELASQLTPLIGQDYGRYAQGYRIDQPSPNQARLVP